MNNQQPNGTDPAADDAELRAALEPFGEILRSPATWASPPDDLEERILAQVRATSAGDPAVAVRRGRSGLLFRVLPAAAAAVLAFLAGVVIADRGDDNDEPEAVAELTMIGTELAPGASAQGEVVDRGAGYAIRLDMEGLAAAAEGSYYEGWLRADDGEMVSVGTFHMRGGDGSVVLWSGVPVGEYPTIVVTEQLERADDQAAERVVMTGDVQRR